jgi:hypothetical protein
MKSRSATLLHAIIQSGEFSADDVARELAASRREIDAYLAEELIMPLGRQLSFALLLIKKSPREARRAHALRSQAVAAMAFHTKKTSVHNEPPSTWGSYPRRGF